MLRISSCLGELSLAIDAEQKEQTGGVNHAEANSCNRSVSAHSSGSLPVHIQMAGSYVVHYTTPAGEIPPKYATGHELLVLVEKNTITYNDMLGRSLQVPIESQRPVTERKQSK